MYVKMLNVKQQEEIKNRLYKSLLSLDEFSTIEIEQVIQQAMNSKLHDLTDIIDIKM